MALKSDGDEDTGYLPTLRRAVKDADIGTGSVQRAIRSAGFKISAREFTRLLRSCRNSGEWERALEILEVIRQEDPEVGAPPNFFTYSAAISVCSKSGRLAETLWLLQEMKAAARVDTSFQPDAVVYRMIIICCLRKSKFDIVLKLFSEMLDEGIEPDDQTLQHVLSALIKNKSWERATNILDKVHQRGKVLPMKEYANFIAACAMDGDLGTATEVFLMMQMMDVMPDADSCHNVMLSVEGARCPMVGFELLKEMHTHGITVYPKTYASLLKTSMEVKNHSILTDVIEMIRVCPDVIGF